MNRKHALIIFGITLVLGVTLYIVSLSIFPYAPYALIMLIGAAPLIAVFTGIGFHGAGWLLGFSLFGGAFYTALRRLCWQLRDLSWGLAKLAYFGLVELIKGLSSTPPERPKEVRTTKHVPPKPGTGSHREVKNVPTSPQLQQTASRRVRKFITNRREK